jgi:riboflavin synthase alpha subunit
MSFAQIIEEIPKLTHSERREIFLRVMSFEPETDDVALCDHVAREGFALLDEMEAVDTANG